MGSITGGTMSHKVATIESKNFLQWFAEHHIDYNIDSIVIDVDNKKFEINEHITPLLVALGNYLNEYGCIYIQVYATIKTQKGSVTNLVDAIIFARELEDKYFTQNILIRKENSCLYVTLADLKRSIYDSFGEVGEKDRFYVTWEVG
jgi:hypothetical protein